MIFRKGDISIQLIVIAAIALLVLIIVAVLFAGKFKSFGTGVQQCVNKGGICESGCESNEVKMPDTECPNACCVDIYDSANDNDV